MSNDSRMDEYVRKCDAYDAREAELNKIVGYRAQYPGGTHAPPPCGCRVEGDGNLQSPLRIRFCEAHARVQT